VTDDVIRRDHERSIKLVTSTRL